MVLTVSVSTFVNNGKLIGRRGQNECQRSLWTTPNTTVAFTELVSYRAYLNDLTSQWK